MSLDSQYLNITLTVVLQSRNNFFVPGFGVDFKVRLRLLKKITHSFTELTKNEFVFVISFLGRRGEGKMQTLVLLQ